MPKTEFYESAVKQGFYGLERSGLFGKKDNVRKYWEDVSIKLSVRDAVERLMQERDAIRIVDLGCGSGEGFELLTHIPPSNPIATHKREFCLAKEDIGLYVGLDISPSMIQQGKKNYQDCSNVVFQQADLSEGFPLLDERPFDMYFSSYCSLSHLTKAELLDLTKAVCRGIGSDAYLVFDVHGRHSPEWPIYWDKTSDAPLRYNMAYLLTPEEQVAGNMEEFDVTYWTPSELIQLIRAGATETGCSVEIECVKDRSILVGRHMDTRFFKPQKFDIRLQVNQMFDRDYRGQMTALCPDMAYLEPYRKHNPDAWGRITHYCQVWNLVICLVKSLIAQDAKAVKSMIETSAPAVSEELKMLAWVYRNADRFPVVDFWASVMGPQVACVLRNAELSLSPGLGCGHSIFCMVRVSRNEQSKTMESGVQ